MPFLPIDKTRILKYQAYSVHSDSITSVTLSKLIDTQLDYLATHLPDLVAVVQADLATLDNLDEQMTTQQGSVNATLIQADVLRWSDTQPKTSGISDRMETIRDRVARLLNQSIDAGVTGGQGMLLRG
jgi:hypothetical protein